MTAQAGAVAAWIDGHPTEPGIYRVRGFHIGHADDFAVVEVVERDGELLTNLHECNSDRHSWLRVSGLSERMQWQRVDTPAAVPVEALEGLVERLLGIDYFDIPGIPLASVTNPPTVRRKRTSTSMCRVLPVRGMAVQSR